MDTATFFILFFGGSFLYILVGAFFLIKEYLPWVYEEVYRDGSSGMPPNHPPIVYQEVAVDVLFGWPADVVRDIRWAYNERIKRNDPPS